MTGRPHVLVEPGQIKEMKRTQQVLTLSGDFTQKHWQNNKIHLIADDIQTARRLVDAIQGKARNNEETPEFSDLVSLYLQTASSLADAIAEYDIQETDRNSETAKVTKADTLWSCRKTKGIPESSALPDHSPAEQGEKEGKEGKKDDGKKEKRVSKWTAYSSALSDMSHQGSYMSILDLGCFWFFVWPMTTVILAVADGSRGFARLILYMVDIYAMLVGVVLRGAGMVRCDRSITSLCECLRD